MPRKPTTLASQTEAQLDALRRQIQDRLAAEKAALAAVDAEKKARAAVVQATEEKRLGKLAYAAGLAGVKEQQLGKAFAQVAQFATDPVAFQLFYDGCIAREWIGKDRIVAIIDEGRDILGHTVEVGG